MTFLIDNNLSFRLISSLEKDFPGSTHVRFSLTVNAHDEAIWDYARQGGYTLLTKDNDFDEISQLEGCPPKIVHLVCGNQTTFFILDLILSSTGEILKFGSLDDANCILKIG